MSLSEKVEQLRFLQQLVPQRRVQWETTKKGFILNILNQLAEEAGLNWRVAVKDNLVNFETVYLTQGDYPSGIYEQQNSTRIDFTRRGGMLLFSQRLYGRIRVWIMYPYVEELEAPEQELELGVFEPDQIDENLITQQFETFLDEMIRWERLEADTKQVNSLVRR